MSESYTEDYIKEGRPNDRLILPAGMDTHFDILECLASNEFCTTLLLSEKNGNKHSVLKCYPKSLMDSEHSEAKLLFGLNHEGLPRFEEENENETMIFVLREYAAGIPFDHYLAEHGTLDKTQAVQIVMELCGILSYLHSQTPPIIHRDIKPSNIVFNPDSGKVTLIDFGISRRYSSESDMDTHNFGTKKFAPPEQYGFAQTDCRADIYALGVLLRFMLMDDFNRPAEDKYLERIIQKCSAFSPKDRYQSVSALKRTLNRVKKRPQIMAIRAAASALVLCAVFAGVFYTVKDIDLPDLSVSEPSDGAYLEENPVSDPVTQPIADEQFTFAEPLIGQAVRLMLDIPDGQPVTVRDLDSVTELYIVGDTPIRTQDEYNNIAFSGNWGYGTINRLDDLRAMINLRVVNLTGQSISDLSPLADCPSIINLNIHESPVTDVSPLASMPRLRFLYLQGSDIQDFSPFSEMRSLEHLFLGWTPLADISEMGDCPTLEWLGISHTNITNLRGIEQFMGLRRLDIAATNIIDFSPLDDMPFFSILQISPEMEKFLHTLSRDDIQVIISG
jgi:serine/threonine protein kinase